MSIKINESAQFDNFVKFATTAMHYDFDTAIAKVVEGGKSGLGAHAITLHKDDIVSAGFTRSAAARENNNRTRALFHGAVVDMFGGESKIPESVRKAMLLSDYGKGRPLTARRILAVNAAINGVKAQNQQTAAAEEKLITDAFNTAKSNAARAYGKTGPDRAMTAEQLDAVIDGLLRATLHDKDAFDIVVKNIDDYLVNGANELRGAEKSLRMAEELLANLDELRGLAKTYRMPGLVKTGVDFIRVLGGKPVETGFLTAIVRAAAATKVDAMKGLGASSRTAAIHQAALQLSRGIDHICTAARAGHYLPGADAQTALEAFIITLQLQRCGAKAQRSIQAALGSEAARKVARVYSDMSNGYITLPPEYSPDMTEAMSGEARRLLSILESSKLLVDRACGVAPDALKPLEAYKGAIDPGDSTVLDIIIDLETDAAERMRRERDHFLTSYVKGGGTAADTLRGIYGQILGEESVAPHDRIFFRKKEFIEAIINRNILSEMRSIAAAGEPKFKQSLAHGLSVSLPGGVKLSADFRTARDQLAAFITKGDRKSYAELENDEEKAKVHIVMALLGEQTEKAILDGMALSLDPDGTRPAFALAMAPGDLREFSLSFTQEGALRVNYEGHKNLRSIRFPQDAEPDRKLGDGSSCDVSFNFDIKANELERLAKLDVNAFDDSAIRDDAERPVPQKNIRDHVKELPEDFRFKGLGTAIGLSFTTTLVDPPKKKAPPPEPVYTTVPRAVAQEAVNHAAGFVTQQYELHMNTNRSNYPLELNEGNIAKAVNLVIKYGRGLTAKGLRLLATNALNAVGNIITANAADEIVAHIARDIVSWRDFEAGDPRFAEVDAKLLDYSKGLLDDYLGPQNADRYDNDGIFSQFKLDANRSTYVIGGQTYRLPRDTNPQPVLDALKTTVKPEHRRMISTLMNQMIDTTTELPTQRMPLPPTNRHQQGMDVNGTQGMELYIRQGENENFYVGSPAAPGLTSAYKVEIAEDGQSAKITVSSRGDLRFNVAQGAALGNNVVGTFTRTQEIELDLSGPDAKIVDLHVSQHFDV